MLGKWQNIICEKCKSPIRVQAMRKDHCWVKCRNCGQKMASDNEGIFNQIKPDDIDLEKPEETNTGNVNGSRF